MRVFVSEFVCGGGWPEERIESSLAREGQSMLLALVEDLSRCRGVEVVTTWDVRLGSCPIGCGDVRVIEAPGREREVFQELVAASDVVWVIAPETGGVLERRQASAFQCAKELANGRCRVIGATERAIFLTGDKLRTGLHWDESGIATPRVHVFDPQAVRPAWKFPIVVKPRDGAGSLNTFLIQNEGQWLEVRHQLSQAASADGNIQQPYVSGKPLSVAMLIDADGSMLEILPVAEQRLSEDGRFRYLGGRIPAAISEDDAWRVTDVVTRGVRALPGVSDLTGYIGCDVVLPDDPSLPPQLIEINPRLTSSYLGYRQLTEGNIPARLLRLTDEPLVWKENVQIEFAV